MSEKYSFILVLRTFRAGGQTQCCLDQAIEESNTSKMKRNHQGNWIEQRRRESR